MQKHNLTELPIHLMGDNKYNCPSVNMNEIVSERDILFLCFDTLRFDAAFEEQESHRTPTLNQYGKWERCFAAGDFTYPSHHAMFAGFLPAPATSRNIMEREMLFFPKGIGMGRKVPANSYSFDEATFVESLGNAGYETTCVGGVTFFDKRSAIGSVFPKMFQHSFWRPSFGCTIKESTKFQFEFVVKRLSQTSLSQRVFYYINISAIHYPNYFYCDIDTKKEDTLMSHKAALRYVDSLLPELFAAFKKRGSAFVIALSDHGTCYGEDNFIFHGLPNPIVNTVPYKHFFL